jgi:hypothetical protein
VRFLKNNEPFRFGIKTKKLRQNPGAFAVSVALPEFFMRRVKMPKTQNSGQESARITILFELSLIISSAGTQAKRGKTR